MQKSRPLNVIPREPQAQKFSVIHSSKKFFIKFCSFFPSPPSHSAAQNQYDERPTGFFCPSHHPSPQHHLSANLMAKETTPGIPSTPLLSFSHQNSISICFNFAGSAEHWNMIIFSAVPSSVGRAAVIWYVGLGFESLQTQISKFGFQDFRLKGFEPRTFVSNDSRSPNWATEAHSWKYVRLAVPHKDQ